MPGWKTLSSEEVYKTQWIRVRRDEVLNHRGTALTYSIVEGNHPAAFIIALNKKGEMLLQRMYRYTTDSIGWEIPAGNTDGDEPLVAAKRELMEEAGMVSDDWQEVGTFYEANGIASLPEIYFLARDAHPAEGERDEDEDIIEHQFMSHAKIERLIRKGEINDLTVLAAMQLANIYNAKKENK